MKVSSLKGIHQFQAPTPLKSYHFTSKCRVSIAHPKNEFANNVNAQVSMNALILSVFISMHINWHT